MKHSLSLHAVTGFARSVYADSPRVRLKMALFISSAFIQWLMMEINRVHRVSMKWISSNWWTMKHGPNTINSNRIRRMHSVDSVPTAVTQQLVPQEVHESIARMHHAVKVIV